MTLILNIFAHYHLIPPVGQLKSNQTMVTRRKRPQSVHDEEPPHQKGNGLSVQQQLRDCWEFAALGQYLFIFGAALKILDNWSIEVRQPVLRLLLEEGLLM